MQAFTTSVSCSTTQSERADVARVLSAAELSQVGGGYYDPIKGILVLETPEDWRILREIIDSAPKINVDDLIKGR